MSVLKTKEGAVVVKGPIKLTQSNGNILEVGTGIDKTVISNGWTGGTGDYLRFEVPSADNEGGVLQLNSNGKVGIGTIAPLRTLELGSPGATLRVGPDYFTANGSTDRDFIELRAHGSDTKIVSPNERFHIENTSGDIILNASGNVGIGTTAPTEKLHVEGIFRAQELSLQSNTSEPKSIRNVNTWQYSSTASLGAEYVHMKVDRRPDSENQMYSVTFRGHSYGASKPINTNLCWYNYSTSNNVINVGTHGSHTCYAYKSSDGYAVMVLYIPSHYYVAFTMDQFSTTQGLTKLTITNVTTSNSSTGAF